MGWEVADGVVVSWLVVGCTGWTAIGWLIMSGVVAGCVVRD